MIDKLKQIIIPLTVLFIAIILVYILIPSYHPFGGLKIVNNKQSILNQSKKYLNKSNVLYNENKLNIGFKTDENFVRWINSEYRINEANKILSDAGTAYYWIVTQDKDEDSEMNVSSNSDGRINLNKTSFSLKILDNGKIIEFNNELPDSTLKNSVSPDEAVSLALEFIKKLRNDITFVGDSLRVNGKDSFNTFYYKETETIKKLERVDYNFTWETKNKSIINYVLNAKVVGDRLSNFSIQAIVPDEYLNNETDVFEVATTIIFTLLIIISVLVVGFKRFRAYEVGFKIAIVFGIFVLVSFIIKELLERFSTFEWTIILGLGLGGIFIAGAAIILWAVSETIFREIWNDKFLSLDLIYHRKINHSSVGKSIINSISFGFGLTALFFVLQYAVSYYSNVVFVGDSFTSQSHVIAYLPLLNIFLGVINGYGILSVAFFMFLTAAIKRYINNDIIFILVSGLTWALLIHSNVSPLTAGLPINLVIGVLLTLILIKYDLLTTLLSFLLFKFFIKATELLFVTETSLKNEWYILVVICSVLFVLGIILVFRKDKFTDYDSITPKFVENITERQRLKKELDVARHVQMSFLPRGNPILKGIDIASICIPAFEVGGDYYDFIHLGKNKLGIIIGDVSGKGTQAAFYMTLTKGFLKAIAKHTDSPSEVLTKMNELFYENVERGRFISMIYAVVDLEAKFIRIARAGHNPVIYHDTAGKVNLISPNGLALGLEKGDLFSKVITEFEEKIEAGKTFIFYTDGFTEAVNKKGDEYGLDRMFEIAKSWNNSSAAEIQEKMMADVNKFIGKAPQHDDMTMVILKIN
ncbi:MAG: PP2C family protein-serine/threonine phosphatase [Ignavibacteriales bacterium]|nr:PP2C family protein-serine/threonine phosphatase [Ignavibacteriales bacterium]